ncbi:MAG: hypothetical protein E7349_03465 [Clostridiales bacterium]|nr:hypothetical protein [Clostridiales bacterium]
MKQLKKFLTAALCFTMSLSALCMSACGDLEAMSGILDDIKEIVQGGQDSGSSDTNNGGGNTNGDSTNNGGNQGDGIGDTQNSGVRNVDFTKGIYAKNVTELYSYVDGCPTISTATANPAVLVIPVEFSDVTAASKGYSIDKIKKAFNGKDGDTDYYSVHDYYYQSSYGKLDLDITVLDSWFKPKHNSSYYKNYTMDYDGEAIAIGDQLIMDEALAELEGKMDLSKFDSDGNYIIDAVVLINTLKIDEDSDFNWAYRYWNIYTDEEDYYYEYDGVSANDYLWAPYAFLYEDEYGFDNKNGMNTYTFIHEFGHVLGAEDYYDTAYVGEPLGGYDIMDAMTGDHNAFTKFHYGWLTSSRLVAAEESITLTLEDFSKNGDTILIANNWDDDCGVYQEYYLLMYYTNNGLNAGVGNGYFDDEGILVYHVNAALYEVEEYEGVRYYDVYNTNTDESDADYGTEDNLIEFVKTSKGGFVYGEGERLSSNIKDDEGAKIPYTFTVDKLTKDVATITFTKNKGI